MKLWETGAPTACGERGIALIAVVFVLAFLMAVAGWLTTSILTESGLRGAYSRATIGFYAAESGLDRGMGEFRNIFMDFRVPTSSDFAPRSFVLDGRTVHYQLRDVHGNPRIVTVPAGQVFAGLNALHYVYVVSSEAVANGETEARVSGQFDVSYIPLFQFVAFYADDLEILPGPEKRLHGRVHTNGNLYLDAGTRLYIEDNQGPSVPLNDRITTVQVTAKGDIYRGRKEISQCNGPVTVDKIEDIVPPTPDLDPLDLPCSGTGTTMLTPAALAPWKGSMVSQVRNISVPSPDGIVKGSGVFWTHADLRIVLKLNQPGQLPGASSTLPHTIEVQDATGAQDVARTALLYQFMTDQVYNASFSSTPGRRPVYYTDVPKPASCSNAAPTGCPNAIATSYTPVFGSNARVYSSPITSLATDLDYRRGGFYNWRERKWMYLLNVNVRDLLDWNQRQPAGSRFFDPADSTDGGLVIFFSVDGPASLAVNNYGVRVFGSRNLVFPAVPGGGDPTGLTVASDQAAYVVGDYNRGNTAAGDLPKQPAAIVADTLNILSNNYFNASACGNDCQSNLALGDAARRGTATAINAAFLAGNDLSLPNDYNGGLENYPRFHEDWSGQPLTYNGSFVSLGTPVHAAGKWCGTGSTCNIYRPPDRIFNYDTAFSDVKNLPPLTPRFVYVEQLFVTQNFD